MRNIPKKEEMILALLKANPMAFRSLYPFLQTTESKLLALRIRKLQSTKESIAGSKKEEHDGKV